MTAAGSAPDCWAMIGTRLRSAQIVELLARGRPERVARREHDAASLGEQPMRELADGGGLAGAVDADDQNDVGLDGGHR